MALVKKKSSVYIYYYFFFLSPFSAPPADDGAPSICLYCLCPGPALHDSEVMVHEAQQDLILQRRDLCGDCAKLPNAPFKISPMG